MDKLVNFHLRIFLRDEGNRSEERRVDLKNNNGGPGVVQTARRSLGGDTEFKYTEYGNLPAYPPQLDAVKH